MVKFLYIFLFTLVPFLGIAQIKDTTPYQFKGYSSAFLDSLPHVYLPEVIVYPPQSTWSKRQMREYTALEYKVRKVYPMAKVAAIRVAEYNRIYNTFKTERERKAYVKQAEKELFQQFEGDIRHMTMSEGRILIKLIDRETSETSFEIIKEFKGGLNAFFWQAVAKIFGHNLKSTYDAQNEDRMIEYIVNQIDMGYI